MATLSMRRISVRPALFGARWLVLACVCALAACATSRQPAPVEDRNPRAPVVAPPVTTTAPVTTAPTTTPPMTAPVDPNAKPGIENAGKPGYYTIKPGDTLIRVGLETGQNARDIARWNNIENPNSLEVGQVIRVTPPGVDPTATTPRGVNTARVDARPLDSRPAPVASAPAPAPPLTAPAITPAPPAMPPAANAPSTSGGNPPATKEPDDDVNWTWPASGAVIAGFDEARNKGLSITGKAGDPVFAAADGRVVYAGSGLRGYGNLVIVKHNNTYLTAYAHNQALLVKEDQVVRRGQKIAEMGSSDADRVQLHFEIRRLGRPIDPARLLPSR